MDPASFTLTVVGAFKDVYLLAKFVQKTVASAKHHHTEKDGLVAEFKIELLHLKSFWRIFTRENGHLIDDDLLNTEWLEKVKVILDQLRTCFSDYAKLAAEIDEDYQKFSPYSGHTIDRPISEFPLEIEDVKQDQGQTERKGVMRMKGWFSLFTDFTTARKSATQLADALRWSLWQKDRLEGTLKEFMKWNSKLKELIPYLLDSGRYLTTPERIERLMGNDEHVNIFKPHLQLRQIAQNPEAATKDQPKLLIDGTEERSLQQILSNGATKPKVLVENKYYVTPSERNNASAKALVPNSKSELYAHQLASLLMTAGSNSFRTLPFKGYFKDQSNGRYVFFFDYPSNAGDREPQSLHDLITVKSSKDKLPLPSRFHIAQAIAQSIGAFHSDGWVHKSIRSHAIKFFFDGDNNRDLENPYLTDFEFSRPASGETRMIPQASDSQRDVYRHPQRYGPPTVGFNKVHDIYSLGVVLLEIGLWETASSMYDDICEQLRSKDPQHKSPSAKELQNIFRSDAERRLGHRMGEDYKDAVVSCLSDQFNDYLGKSDFAMTFQKLVVQKVDIKRLLNASD